MATTLSIVVVEDHDELREVTVDALLAQGHHVHGVDSAEALDERMVRFPADLLILDVGLPGEDGISIARRIRAAQPDIGIIMVTARNQTRDITSGYDSGADIYVTKPVSPDELEAAINALARRLRPERPLATQLSVNTKTLMLHGPSGSAALSDSDVLLLAKLAQAPDNRQETWQLLEAIGKTMDESEKRALTVHIVRLRKKLEQAGAEDPTIKSIRGSGYQLCLPLRIDHSAG